MTTPHEAPSPEPRLNPFAFPSDTDFRFILLIVTVVGSSLYLYDAMYLRTSDWRQVHEECLRQAPVPASSALSVFSNPFATGPLDEPTQRANAEFTAAYAARTACNAASNLAEATWAIAGVLLLAVVAGCMYWFFPALKIRREHLVELTPEDAPEVLTDLADLCREAGLAKSPTFVCNPLISASSGLAFGRFGRYYVALNGGLVVQHQSDRPAFQAIVLHELAHLRNADVDKAYLALAVWWAFVLVGLVPYAVARWDPDYLLSIVWRLLALAALVYAMRNAVLRAREMYADARAAVWDGPAGALRRVLQMLPSSGRWQWSDRLGVHPVPAERRRVLDHPGALFRLGSWDAFATGLAVAVAYPHILNTVETLNSGMGSRSSSFAIAPLVTAALIAPVVMGVVGLATWRMTFALRAGSDPNAGTWRLGSGLALGLVLGQTLALTFGTELAAASSLSEPSLLEFSWAGGGLAEPSSLVALIVSNLVWGMLLAGGFCLFLRWVVAGASTWLDVAATAHSPRPFYAAGFATGLGVLVLWLGFIFLVRSVALGPLWNLSNPSVLAVLPLLVLAALSGIPAEIVMLALVCLWIFPLAAALHHSAPAPASPRWVLLNPSTQQPVPRDPVTFRIKLALISGLASGGAFCGLLLVGRILRRLLVTEAESNTFESRITFVYLSLGAAVLMQAGVAALLAARIRQLAVVHALFSAFAAGCVMATGFVVLNLAFGGTAAADFVWITFMQMVNGGGLAALPLALIVAGFAGQARARRSNRS